RPWLGGRAANEPGCENKLKLLVRTASDAYFSQVVSALRLPPAEESPLARRVREPAVWKLVQKVKRTEQLALLLETQDELVGALKGFDLGEVVAAIEAQRGQR